MVWWGLLLMLVVGVVIGGVKRRVNHLQLKSRKSSNEFTTEMRLQEQQAYVASYQRTQSQF